jgi:hypothetical protein
MIKGKIFIGGNKLREAKKFPKYQSAIGGLKFDFFIAQTRFKSAWRSQTYYKS